MDNISTLGGVVDRRVLELGKVLARQTEDRRGVLGLEGDEVGGRGFVSVGRTPDSGVGESAEVRDGLDRPEKRERRASAVGLLSYLSSRDV